MRFFTTIFILLSFSAKAQFCSGLGGTPSTAIAVCGTLVFPQPFVHSCFGSNLPFFNCTAIPTSDNSVWYKFHCYTTGTLGFTIAPASPNDDYDWYLADITGHDPDDVFATDLSISVNLSAQTPNTGCSATGSSNLNCEGGTNPMNSLASLIAGHDYLLCVTNWSNSGQGYDLSFSGGTAVLTNNLPPAVTNVELQDCNPSLIKVEFSEDILCNSLTAAASEILITNGTHVITTVSSNCSSATNAFTTLTLQLATPLAPGNYQLIVNNGTDLNTLSDVCGDFLVAGQPVSFTVPVQLPLSVNNISVTGCAASVIKVALNKPVLCNTATGAGSEFSIIPGNPGIASVTTSCRPDGTTDTLRIVMQQHLPNGNYQLSINDGSDGNTFADACGASFVNGYQVPFTVNDLNAAPVIQTIQFDECFPSKVVVTFNEPVLCASMHSDNFLVSPGTATVAAATWVCPPAGYVNQVTLSLSENLPAGNFTVRIVAGADGNTISDTCYAYIPANYSSPFTTTKAALPRYDSVQFKACDPTELKVFYSQPIACNSYSCDGSEFYLTGPDAIDVVSVSGAVANCCQPGAGSTAATNWILVHFNRPITVGGNYILHNKWGADNNSILSTCNALQDTLETISFNVKGRPSAAFNDEIRWGCVRDTIRLSHPGNGVNAWTWNFSDGSTVSGQTAAPVFPVTDATATVELIVSNGSCNDTLQRTYTLGNAIDALFDVSHDTACINTAIDFTNHSTGSNLLWHWDFGDHTTAGSEHGTHGYASATDFEAMLVITDEHGCKDTARKFLDITNPPVVSFSGLENKYCTGDNVTLLADITGGNVSSYSWHTGVGTLHDEPQIVYPYTLPGNYTISLDVSDRFCPLVSSNQSTVVFKTPIVNLGKDTSLCPGITMKIGIIRSLGFEYLWNTGATVPEIVTGLQTHNYHLTVKNNGCIGEDEVLVVMKENCLIKVPGAFTPGYDGLNDKLKAINADLATNFTFSVYNRFGQLIFRSHDPLRGWDGTFKGNPVDAGTYVWQLRYVHPITHKPVYEKGTSLLIR